MRDSIRFWLGVLVFWCLTQTASAQMSSSIVLDAASLKPVNVDAVTGLALDPIAKDRSNRPCARIKLHINRMTSQEIREIDVRAIGGNVMITKQMMALGGNGLIIELTAKEETRFYLHHDRFGDSNSVNLTLEGNKEYTMEAWNETKLSVVISYSVPGADVYLDGAYIGAIGSDNHLSVKDVSMGPHRLGIKAGSSNIARNIQVSPDQVFFNIDAQSHSRLQGFVLFKVGHEDAQVWLEGEQIPLVNGIAQKLTQYGTYSYYVSAPGHYAAQGEIEVDSGQISNEVILEAISPADDSSYRNQGRISVSGGNSVGAQVYVDSKYVGDAPLTTGFLTVGEHSVRVSRKNYLDYESRLVVDGGSIYRISPVLKPNFKTVRLTADEGSQILIDNELKGIGSWEGDLVYGDYVIESRKEGHVSGTDRITVREDMLSTDIRLSHLQAICGSLSITSVPIGASILIDGQNKGVTPLFLNDIPIGEYAVAVVKNGYEQWEETVVVSDGYETSVAPVLHKTLGIDTKEITAVTRQSVKAGGSIVDDGTIEVLEKGVVWSLSPNPTVDLTTRVEAGSGTAAFDCEVTGLLPSTKYCLKAYAVTSKGVFYGEQVEFTTQGEKTGLHSNDLASQGTANCYIISSPGIYNFPPVKGNSSESVGAVESAKILWESYGTDQAISAGDLINMAMYNNGRIIIRTSEVFKEGNAVVAALDKDGTILWSWHIWLTDKPQEQIYANNAGTMMDRNLGAVSVTPGYIGTLGLLYQWGRKDPFLNTSSISSGKVARSSTKWPTPVNSTLKNGQVDFVTENPMVLVRGTEGTAYDWLYDQIRDDSLWGIEKSIYDPCPVGWRVPSGGRAGVWALSGFGLSGFELVNAGASFNNDGVSLWYPATSYLDISQDSEMGISGHHGYYWAVAPSGGESAMALYEGGLYSSGTYKRSSAFSVRCQKEDGSIDRVQLLKDDTIDLAKEGIANCYIVSGPGTYSFPTVVSKSSNHFSRIADAYVLWESYGTDEGISKGDLIQKAIYDNGRVYFRPLEPFREGNAVIAVRDSLGTILWSWHIWLTDPPLEQVYNDSYTMMDRNLGATSTVPGNAASMGLLYQWGRKDPFLGSSINNNIRAKSSIIWQLDWSSPEKGTSKYVIAHPTTYIRESTSTDWYYAGRYDQLWMSEKTLYDPCPVGWRVPDLNDGLKDCLGGMYDSVYKGYRLTTGESIWYPAAGLIQGSYGTYYKVGEVGLYWTVSTNGNQAEAIRFSNDSRVSIEHSSRANAMSVRCVKDSE